ncbi:MAG: hypothetical protein ABI837_18655 [Acidobacteriota bacterium]
MADPASIHEHTLDNLRYIRKPLEKAGSYTSIPGWGAVAIGITALVTCVIAQGPSGGRPRVWLTIWLGEAVVAASIGVLTMWRKTRQPAHAFRMNASRRLMASSLAPLLSAALLTLVAADLGDYVLMPPLWLLFYGSAFVSSRAFALRVVPIMGLSFLLLGGAACAVSLPAGNILLGIGFGGVHIVFGLIIARSHGG